MVVRLIKPLVRDVVGYGLHAASLTRPDDRLFYSVTFHRVLPASALAQYPLAELAVTPEDFRWFMTLFAEYFSCGTLKDTFGRFKDGERPKKPFLAITFDDGQLDNFEYARPELDRAGLKASFFVPVEAIAGNEVLWHDRLGFAASAYIDRSPQKAKEAFRQIGVADDLPRYETINAAVAAAKGLDPKDRLAWVERIETEVGGTTRPDWDGMMTWDQLRKLVEDGHEVGSHSMSHQILTQLDREALDLRGRGESPRARRAPPDVCVLVLLPERRLQRSDPGRGGVSRLRPSRDHPMGPEFRRPSPVDPHPLRHSDPTCPVRSRHYVADENALAAQPLLSRPFLTNSTFGAVFHASRLSGQPVSCAFPHVHSARGPSPT